jgi:GAF domain-containing protein
MVKTDARHPLVSEMATLLNGPANGHGLYAALDRVLGYFRCVTGTLHGFDAATGLLYLRAHRGLPESLLQRIQQIPIGKGMAGLAAQQRQPVQICNLQTDTSMVVQPAARECGMAGSIAVPLLDVGVLRGVLGLARPTTDAFEYDEIALLQEVGNALVVAVDVP